MPVYSFKCGHCEFKWDLMQRISDPYPTDCPKCNTKNIVEKIFDGSPPGVAFKGPGWFSTGGY